MNAIHQAATPAPGPTGAGRAAVVWRYEVGAYVDHGNIVASVIARTHTSNGLEIYAVRHLDGNEHIVLCSGLAAL